MKYNKYIVKGHYKHIKDKGEYYASNLFELLEIVGITYFEMEDEEIEEKEDELLELGHTVFGDYVIEIERVELWNTN